jgi:hypothetical protein
MDLRNMEHVTRGNDFRAHSVMYSINVTIFTETIILTE